MGQLLTVSRPYSHKLKSSSLSHRIGLSLPGVGINGDLDWDPEKFPKKGEWGC